MSHGLHDKSQDSVEWQALAGGPSKVQPASEQGVARPCNKSEGHPRDREAHSIRGYERGPRPGRPFTNARN